MPAAAGSTFDRAGRSEGGDGGPASRLPVDILVETWPEAAPTLDPSSEAAGGSERLLQATRASSRLLWDARDGLRRLETHRVSEPFMRKLLGVRLSDF